MSPPKGMVPTGFWLYTLYNWLPDLHLSLLYHLCIYDTNCSNFWIVIWTASYDTADAIAKILFDYPHPDFILKFKKNEGDDSVTNSQIRRNFERLLLLSGLLVEFEDDASKECTFVKLWVPFKRMCQEAEELKLKMPLDVCINTIIILFARQLYTIETWWFIIFFYSRPKNFPTWKSLRLAGRLRNLFDNISLTE